MKVLFEFEFINDMYRTEKDDLLTRESMRTILEVAIDNCLLMTDSEFYQQYGIDENPEDWCYEVVFSDEYIESFWFSVEDFWNSWDEFKLDRFGAIQ